MNLKENVPSFHFPSEETHSELRKEWIKFVNQPFSNWKSSKSSVTCINILRRGLLFMVNVGKL